MKPSSLVFVCSTKRLWTLIYLSPVTGCLNTASTLLLACLVRGFVAVLTCNWRAACCLWSVVNLKQEIHARASDHNRVSSCPRSRSVVSHLHDQNSNMSFFISINLLSLPSEEHSDSFKTFQIKCFSYYRIVANLQCLYRAESDWYIDVCLLHLKPSSSKVFCSALC